MASLLRTGGPFLVAIIVLAGVAILASLVLAGSSPVDGAAEKPAPTPPISQALQRQTASPSPGAETATFALG